MFAKLSKKLIGIANNKQRYLVSPTLDYILLERLTQVEVYLISSTSTRARTDSSGINTEKTNARSIAVL